LPIPGKREPTFTSDWTWQVRDTWPRHVFPYLDRANPIHWLEISSFEGRSTLWTIENMFQHPDSTITCVDAWNPFPRYGKDCDFNYEETFDLNTYGFAGLIKHKGKSNSVLPTLKPGSFHGCYIDGSHDKDDVLGDAHMIWSLMRPRAVVVFDDYGWGEKDSVKQAVDELLIEWKSKINILHIGYQAVILVKP
jgi:Methyltransferase domain